MTGRLRPAQLRMDARLSVEYEDQTVFGGPLSPKLQQNLKTLYAPIYRALKECGPLYVMEHCLALMGQVRGEPLFETIRDPENRLRFAPGVLYPDSSKIVPVAVHASCEDGSTHSFDASGGLLPRIHDVIGSLAGDPRAEEIGTIGMEGIIDAGGPFELAQLPESDATFIGHNAVLIRSGADAVLVDPWILHRSERFGATYQPLVRRQLGPVDAILLTHSHPDHFDPGTLLQFHRGTQIVIPRLERETLLSADLDLRLRELGFENIVCLDWWQQMKVGDIEIAALPFFGEQPTNSEQICPEVRMMGNTYEIRTPRFSCALIADSGRDREGDVRAVALEAFRRWGPIDALFTGYRGWSLYPIQYFESSVRQYLLFAPQFLYTVRQSIMNGIAEAVDTAEAWHANFVVPYGDGGAPWYSELGLGTNPGAREWAHFDPPPEHVIHELQERTSPVPGVVAGSHVRPLLLRPGQSFRMEGSEPVIAEIGGHRWPRKFGASA